MENWDLEAIVRGCTSEFAKAVMDDQIYYSRSSCFVPFDQEPQVGDDFFDGVYDQHKTRVNLDELDELYKPFYPQSIDINIDSSIECAPCEVQVPGFLPCTDVVNVPVPKRRKNVNKRVVEQVMIDDLSSDTWAWRKYGQKPIKGSPYPRSYYRCSSSKGCSAKKQVERSSSNPVMFIITYSDDHNHSHPIRKNTLAGISKKKITKVKSTSFSSSEAPTKESPCCSPISSTTVFSPTSPLISSGLVGHFFHDNKQTRIEDDEQTFDDSMDLINFTDISAHDDWFLDPFQSLT